MNIPENILQQVADEAFLSSNGGMMGLLTCNKEKNHVFWHEERCERRAVIQHAISNPALAPFLAAEALARAEKAEAELAGIIEAANEESRKDHVKYSQLANKLEGAQAELVALKSSQLGILRPIAEMPETVPEGHMAVFRWRDDFGSWVTGINKPTNGFFTILRLPDAEATPPTRNTRKETHHETRTNRRTRGPESRSQAAH